jgi:hypothetical protein
LDHWVDSWAGPGCCRLQPRDQHRKQEGGLRGYVVSLCYGARKDDEGERELCPMNVVCFGSAMEEGTLKASDRACPPAVGFS